jgi:hypothetical protein
MWVVRVDEEENNLMINKNISKKHEKACETVFEILFWLWKSCADFYANFLNIFMFNVFIFEKIYFPSLPPQINKFAQFFTLLNANAMKNSSDSPQQL